MPAPTWRTPWWPRCRDGQTGGSRLAAEVCPRPPFYLGVGFVLLGTLLSVFAAKETMHHVAHESKLGATAEHDTGAAVLGLGTAMVYPTLLAAIGDVAHPSWRASSVGVYRLWRDMGYAVGALLAGGVADALGLAAAILTIAALTLGSGVVVAVRMRETLRPDAPAPAPSCAVGASLRLCALPPN